MDLHTLHSRVPFRVAFSDIQWLSEIFNDTKHRAVSLRQLGFSLVFYIFFEYAFSLGWVLLSLLLQIACLQRLVSSPKQPVTCRVGLTPAIYSLCWCKRRWQITVLKVLCHVRWLANVSVMPSSAVEYKKLSCCRDIARCFVSLNISLNHSRSLTVIRNDTLEWGVCKYPLVYYSNYVCISYRFLDIQHHNYSSVTFKSVLGVVQGHWNGTVRELGYGFLSIVFSNYDRIFSRMTYSCVSGTSNCELKSNINKQKSINVFFYFVITVDVLTSSRILEIVVDAVHISPWKRADCALLHIAF